MKCVAVRGSTVVAAGSDGEVRVTDVSAAGEGAEGKVLAEAATGARITSCAVAALQ